MRLRRSLLALALGLAASAGSAAPPRPLAKADPRILNEVLDALKVMQDEYFEPWQGTWPDAIDWTAAVMGTHVAGALNSLSRSLDIIGAGNADSRIASENLVAGYFSQVLSFYFGQDHVAIRGQAYDDILWVVLGWLEAVKFVDLHSSLYFSSGSGAAQASSPSGASADASGSTSGRPDGPGGPLADPAGSTPLENHELRSESTPPRHPSRERQHQASVPDQAPFKQPDSRRQYFGNVWSPAFAHRSRIFWDLATKGWDTKYCGGGMTWNPRLLMYKNAITNELFFAASASMYLYFPGDDNSSPFREDDDEYNRLRPYRQTAPTSRGAPHLFGGAHDIKHLEAAMAAHTWLKESGMKNGRDEHPSGLYIDGFHISGLEDPNNDNTKCDVRNSMVFTYNQGVVLTGLRGLFKANGDEDVVREGHELIRDVIKATGWDLARDIPIDAIPNLKPGQLPPWRGMGRAGVLEDACDVSATCSQDSQTFKGIFFHHLTEFCAPLDLDDGLGHSYARDARAAGSSSIGQMHVSACSSYRGWIAHNAKAAVATRDGEGKFGMWWTAGLLHFSAEDVDGLAGNNSRRIGPDAVDYRSDGVPNDPLWVGREQAGNSASSAPRRAQERKYVVTGKHRGPTQMNPGHRHRASDPNDRGRGRTVETQSGGLALLRALWEVSNLT